MNKKLITGALAGMLSTGMVVPALANEKGDINDLYRVAYDATMKAKTEKTQKSVNEARIAVNTFRNACNTEGLHSMANTLSVILDEVQQPILSNIVKSALKAQETKTQADVNIAYVALPAELRDLDGTSDKEFWRNTYNSYKVAIDEVQTELQDVAFAAVKKAEASKKAIDVEAARTLVTEVQGSVIKPVADWATLMLERVNAIVVGDNEVEGGEVVKAVKAAKTVKELADALEKYSFVGYTANNLNSYMEAKIRFQNDINTIGDVQTLVIDAGNLDVKNQQLVNGIVNAPNTVVMTRLMEEAGITRVNEAWGAQYNTVIIGSGMTRISEIQAKVNTVNMRNVDIAFENCWEATNDIAKIDAAAALNETYYPEVTSKQREQKESHKKHLGIQKDLATVVHATTVEEYKAAIAKLDASSNLFSKGIVNNHLVERYMPIDGTVVTIAQLQNSIKTETKTVITLASKNLYKVANKNSGLTAEQFANDKNAQQEVEMAFDHLKKATEIEKADIIGGRFDVKLNKEYYHGYVQALASGFDPGINDINIDPVAIIETIIEDVNNRTIFERLEALKTVKTEDEAFKILSTVAKEVGVKSVVEANKAHYFNNKESFIVTNTATLQNRVDTVNEIAKLSVKSSTTEVQAALLQFGKLTNNKTILNIGENGRKDLADLIIDRDANVSTIAAVGTTVENLNGVRADLLSDVNNALIKVNEYIQDGQDADTAFVVLARSLNAIPGISGVDVVVAETFYNNSMQKDNPGTSDVDESKSTVTYGNFSDIRVNLK